ncbi:hypothetical protein OF83DRAFT_1174530 [Amylostereum chailletii]|nr:hypothetical protein OF83DRAFT_1174530 [Amylostereum chailletii]
MLQGSSSSSSTQARTLEIVNYVQESNLTERVAEKLSTSDFEYGNQGLGNQRNARHTHMSALSPTIPRMRELLKVLKWSDGSARLVWVHDEKEEATFVFRGVIIEHDLPPVSSIDDLPSNIRWARQSIALSGMGSQTFTDVVRGIKNVHKLMDSAYKVGTLKTWWTDNILGDPRIELSNRYITPHDQLYGASAVTIPKTVDPYGILARVSSQVGVYTEENVVTYFQRKESVLRSDARTDTEEGSEEGEVEEEVRKVEYEAVDPSIVRTGQIVEVHTSFATVPLAGLRRQTSRSPSMSSTMSSFKMVAQLRSIAIIDQEITDGLDAWKSTQHPSPATTTEPPMVLKRKAGYDLHPIIFKQKRAKRPANRPTEDVTNASSPVPPATRTSNQGPALLFGTVRTNEIPEGRGDVNMPDAVD